VTTLAAARSSVGSRLVVDFAAVTAFAALTALGARVQFRLPFTPVPVTGQVFCVLLAGAVLGARLGFVSQVEYLAAGAAGLPVLAHGGGPLALLGPTGGYLLGFPLAAATVGALCSRWSDRGRVGVLSAGLAGVAVIYGLGAPWYAVWMAATGVGASLPLVLAQAVFPFALIDGVKAGAVAALVPPAGRRPSAG